LSEEPAWLTRLAQAGSAASANKQRRERRTGSLGAASEGKRLMSWACKCGWTGISQELKATGSPAQHVAEYRTRREKSGVPRPRYFCSQARTTSEARCYLAVLQSREQHIRNPRKALSQLDRAFCEGQPARVRSLRF